MPRAAKSIELLRQRKASGELPLLSLPARRDDINAWQPIIDRYRSHFDDVVVLGIGGSSLGGATLCRLADSGKLGRATCRESVCPYVLLPVVDATLQKTISQDKHT